MNDTDNVMTSIYNVLLQLRYPHITNVESKDLGSTILNGENRVCLLSWLLTEKSPSTAAQLRKLKDDALEDKLLEYYSQIGICNNKNILLGKCSLKEQLPVLRLLLDFMRKVHIEPFANVNETEGTLMDILKLYIDDTVQASCLPIVKPKLNFTEANKYFKEIEKELHNNDYKDIQVNLPGVPCIKIDNESNNEEQQVLFDKEKEKFIETFQIVSSWPMQSKDLDKHISDSICSNIKSICSDFRFLKKVLEAKHEICNVNLARGLTKTDTPLNAIIEDIVIYNEEIKNLSMENDNID